MKNTSPAEIKDFFLQLTQQFKMLMVELPSDFDVYWETVVDKTARTDYRKAEKQGYTFRLIDQVDKRAWQDILDIYRSAPERQGREINYYYTNLDFTHHDVRTSWPRDGYAIGGNNVFELWTLEREGKIYAFVETIFSDGVMMVHMAMCHHDHLQVGAMKYLFIELIKANIPRVKKLVYGDENFLKDQRRHFVQELGITTPFSLSTITTGKKTIVLDADDLEVGKPGLEHILKLKEHYPGLKFTLFMVPIPQAGVAGNITSAEYKKWAKFLVKNKDWLEICPHGVMHAGHEMKWEVTKSGKQRLVNYETANLYIDAAEHTFKQLNLPFAKIWKSPHWESSPDTLKALWDRGYTVAVDPNQEVPLGGPVYLYNWSFDQPIPDISFLKGHGHMHTPGANRNALERCMRNLLKMPTDAEFKFISEVL